MVRVAGAAARSRNMVALARRPLWGSTADLTEETRASLQDRLNRYSKLMFWSFVTLMVFLGLAYRFVLDAAPVHTSLVFSGAVVLLGIMAAIWRLVLYRGTPSVNTMYGIDLLFGCTIGLAFGAAAAMQHDLKSAAYTSLLFTCFTVFTRALIVPSSARRTAIVSSLTFVPLVGASLFLAFRDQDVPPSAYIGGGVMFCTVAVVIAANGSGIIYDLRHKVRDAMQLGKYTLDRRIGAGGIGTVYLAHHELLRRPVAVKLLQPGRNTAEDLDRFEGEVQVMSRLTHPNTVAVFDYGRSVDGELYYAMEYLDGIDLEQLVRLDGAQPAGRVIHILAQVCGALQEAHDAKFIHRDIKPANIILCERGGISDVAKVVDFGLVKEVTNEASSTTQAILGTPQYLAPELAHGGPITPAVDLYALGAVGYWLLTGRRVFEGKNTMDWVIKHVMQPATPPSQVTTNHVPPALEAILLRCLAKAPEERFASATALAEALLAVPAPRDWDRSHARAWWADFRARASAAAPSDAATISITIDFEKRVA